MNINRAADPTDEGEIEPQPLREPAESSSPPSDDSSLQPAEQAGQQALDTTADLEGAEIAPEAQAQALSETEQATTPPAPVNAAASAPDAVNTEPFDTVVTSRGKDTTPLPENGGPPSPPLAEGALLNERYQVAAFVGVSRDSNLYRVTDLQGYRRCWACGSDSSMAGDIYCVECGAQLAGRYYRLQEFNLVGVEDASTTENLETGPQAENAAPDGQPPVLSPQSSVHIVPAILENRVPGVAHVYDLWVDGTTRRVYVAWEEASGRTLASWLPGSTVTDELLATQSGHLAVPQEPEEEQVLAWMVQVAELLARLHDEGIAGCGLELSNLLVQPGDRILLLDPSGCTATDRLSMEERDAAELSDVRSLAGELERWYMAVRKEASYDEVGSGPLTEDSTGGVGSPIPMVAAYEVTGPLGRHMNPAVALSQAREGSYPTAHAFAEVLSELYEISKPLTNLKLWSGRSSDVGRVRKINEDSVLTLEATVLEHEGNLPVALYVISDGMGGHQSGEVASSIAARTIGAVVNSSLIAPLVSGDPVARDANTCGHLLQQALLEANRRIAELARERHSDLGTTTVVALLIGNQLTVANVGDSRAYLWHDNGLQVITRDHSLVMQLVIAGQIKPEDIYTHPRRNEIFRALGDQRLTEDEIDVYNQRLRPGDGLLLCSDGLWDFVRDPDIAATLASPGADPQSITQVLVDRANMNGGEDNISVVFARVMASET